MLQSNAPAKLVLPFANSGAKNTIPVASQIGITPGAASLTDGFPPLTRTPLVAGGVPPSGLDMNGVLFALAAIDRWSNAGGRYYYDSAFATDTEVNGYPKGAVVLASDGNGGWLNTVDDNETDPEAGGAGWVPDSTYGSTAIVMTNANVTLTPLQASKSTIVITGALTANLNLVFPNYVKEWTIVNNCTGAFTITCKTAAGSGIAINIGQTWKIRGDSVNIVDAINAGQTAAQFDNDTSLATTAFVQRAIGNMAGGTVSDLASVTLTAADVGKFYTLSLATAQTATLPLLSTVPDGATILLHNPSGSIKTIQRQGDDQISPDGSFITSVTMLQGEVIEFVKQASVWRAYGTGVLKYSTSFGASLVASGYQKLPSGLIIQWGAVANTEVAGSPNTLTFPIAFPTQTYSVVITPNVAGAAGYSSTDSVLALNGTTYKSSFGASLNNFFIVIGK